MDNITIPPEALEAAARAVHEIDRRIAGDDWPSWEQLTPNDQRWRMQRARAACLAMLKNWPGMRRNKPSEGWFGPYLILPLTQENTNAET